MGSYMGHLDNFTVSWDTSVGFDSNATTVIIPLQLSYRIYGLIGGAKYYFRVAGINDAGRGPWSLVEDSGPSIASLTPRNGPVIGGNLITVSGNRLGTVVADVNMYIGNTKCSQIVLVENNKRMACRVPRGYGGKQDLKLEVQGLFFRVTKWFEYDPPVVTAVIPSSASSVGHERLTVHGRNFGYEDGLPSNVSVVHRKTEPCEEKEYIADSSMVCITAPGSATNNSVVVDLGGIFSGAFVRGSLLTYTDVPAYFSCAISQDEECYDCCFNSCYLDLSMRSTSELELFVPGLDVYGYCERECFVYCTLDQPIQHN